VIGIFGGDMTTLAGPAIEAPMTRRQRAAKTVVAALRGGVLGAAIAGIAWLVAGMLAATAFAVLVVATIGVAAWTVMRDSVPLAVWVGLAVAWAVVIIERATVQEHGGLWVGAAAWLGVILGARRAGISKWALPLLAYPVACGVIAVAADQSLADPWGTSWLWVPAVLGPVIGARTLLKPPETRD
jgi:hypothetical protein